MAVWCWGWAPVGQDREHLNYGIPFYDWKTRYERFSDALEISQRLLDQTEPVSFDGFHTSVKDAVLLPRPQRRPPILIGGNGPKRTLPLAARFADEWNAVFIDADGFDERNRRLTGLIEAAGRDPETVKRSVMLPLEWVEGDDAVEVLSAYVKAGCERFMIQITEYDNLDPVEEWASRHLASFN